MSPGSLCQPANAMPGRTQLPLASSGYKSLRQRLLMEPEGFPLCINPQRLCAKMN